MITIFYPTRRSFPMRYYQMLRFCHSITTRWDEHYRNLPNNNQSSENSIVCPLTLAFLRQCLTSPLRGKHKITNNPTSHTGNHHQDWNNDWLLKSFTIWLDVLNVVGYAGSRKNGVAQTKKCKHRKWFRFFIVYLLTSKSKITLTIDVC